MFLIKSNSCAQGGLESSATLFPFFICCLMKTMFTCQPKVNMLVMSYKSLLCNKSLICSVASLFGCVDYYLKYRILHSLRPSLTVFFYFIFCSSCHFEISSKQVIAKHHFSNILIFFNCVVWPKSIVAIQNIWFGNIMQLKRTKQAKYIVTTCQ